MIPGLGQATLLALFGGALYGGDEATERTQAFELQHVVPTQAARQIHLTNASWFFAEQPHFGGRLTLKLGATASRASGRIEQTSGSFEDGTFRAETLDSAAWGLGPTVGASLRLAQAGRATLALDASGSLMFYDRAFPSGGTRVNGMLQAGPSVSWDLSRGGNVTLGARWLHISNGQGLGAHNPAYDGRGLYAQWQRPLRGKGTSGAAGTAPSPARSGALG
jgi:hypothetical protein